MQRASMKTKDHIIVNNLMKARGPGNMNDDGRSFSHVRVGTGDCSGLGRQPCNGLPPDRPGF